MCNFLPNDILRNGNMACLFANQSFVLEKLSRDIFTSRSLPKQALFGMKDKRTHSGRPKTSFGTVIPSTHKHISYINHNRTSFLLTNANTISTIPSTSLPIYPSLITQLPNPHPFLPPILIIVIILSPPTPPTSPILPNRDLDALVRETLTQIRTLHHTGESLCREDLKDCAEAGG